MPFYRLIRRVIFRPGSQETLEVWGVDRPPARLPIVGAPRFTDEDDPLQGKSGPCSALLVMRDGDYVTWHRFFEWLSEAMEAGYRLVSGLEKLSPLTTFLIEGP
jgi:hypothetical protein